MFGDKKEGLPETGQPFSFEEGAFEERPFYFKIHLAKWLLYPELPGLTSSALPLVDHSHPPVNTGPSTGRNVEFTVLIRNICLPQDGQT